MILKIFTAILRFITALVIIAIIGGAIAALTLPPKIKPALEDRLSALFKLPVSIDSVSFTFPSTIRLNGITARAIEYPAGKAAIDIPMLTISPSLPSLLKDKKLVIDVESDAVNLQETRLSGRLRIHFFQNTNKPLIEKIELIDFTVANPLFGQLTENINGTVIPGKPDEYSRIDLTSKNLSVTGVFQIVQTTADRSYEHTIKEVVSIKNLDITLLSSTVSLSGELSNYPNRQLNTLDLSLSSRIALKDLSFFFPSQAKTFERLKPDGYIVLTNVRVNGNPSKVTSISVQADVACENAELSGQRLSDIRTTVSMNKGIVSLPMKTYDIYGGRLSLECQCSPFDDGKPFAVTASFYDVDFSKVIQHTGLKGNDISGQFKGSLVLKGLLLDQKTYTGQMFLQVTNGNLGPLPLFNPVIGHISFVLKELIPGYERATLTESAGNFVIRDRRIATEDLAAWGETASVHGRGYVDFDGHLDLDVQNNFTEAATSNFADAVSGIVKQFGNSISNGKLTGTLQKPQFKSTSMTDYSSIFKGAADLFKDIF